MARLTNEKCGFPLKHQSDVSISTQLHISTNISTQLHERQTNEQSRSLSVQPRGMATAHQLSTRHPMQVKNFHRSRCTRCFLQCATRNQSTTASDAIQKLHLFNQLNSPPWCFLRRASRNSASVKIHHQIRTQLQYFLSRNENLTFYCGKP